MLLALDLMMLAAVGGLFWSFSRRIPPNGYDWLLLVCCVSSQVLELVEDFQPTLNVLTYTLLPAMGGIVAGICRGNIPKTLMAGEKPKTAK
jgi:hypothetical protein